MTGYVIKRYGQRQAAFPACCYFHLAMNSLVRSVLSVPGFVMFWVGMFSYLYYMGLCAAPCLKGRSGSGWSYADLGDEIGVLNTVIILGPDCQTGRLKFIIPPLPLHATQCLLNEICLACGVYYYSVHIPALRKMCCIGKERCTLRNQNQDWSAPQMVYR